MFSDIVPGLRAGRADLGVLIHEGRLTYERESQARPGGERGTCGRAGPYARPSAIAIA